MDDKSGETIPMQSLEHSNGRGMKFHDSEAVPLVGSPQRKGRERAFSQPALDLFNVSTHYPQMTKLYSLRREGEINVAWYLIIIGKHYCSAFFIQKLGHGSPNTEEVCIEILTAISILPSHNWCTIIIIMAFHNLMSHY